MTAFLIVNGPPRSGKSTMIAPFLARAIHLLRPNLVVGLDSFAGPMKNFVAHLLFEEYDKIAKDTPSPVLNNLTPRQFLIKLSEEWMKPGVSSTIFADSLAVRSKMMDVVVCDDCGFEIERDAIAGPDTTVFVCLVDRDGCSFDGDSRGYLSNPNATLVNNGANGWEDQAFQVSAMAVVNAFVAKADAYLRARGQAVTTRVQ